jgi:uncharacterized damage-inducible protein DinB
MTRARRQPLTGTEREMLQGFLDYARRTILWKLEGLDQEQATRRLVPSDSTMLGIVKHLSDVEKGWFCEFMAGEKISSFYTPEDPNADFRIEPGETLGSITKVYREACKQADRCAAEFELGDISRRPGRPKRTLRWIYFHMIDETARHCGQLDILREQIDGVTGY